MLRRWLDLDADPQAIATHLRGAGLDAVDGLRLPGCPDRFELAVRGLLGQQVTVAAARTLASTARAQWVLFTPGTGPSSGVKTDALPAIWTQKSDFDAASAKLVAEADKLVGLAGSGNTAAVLAQFKVVGGTCAACHRQFRADE